MPLQVPAPTAQDVCFYDLGRDSAAKTRAELNSVPIYRVLASRVERQRLCSPDSPISGRYRCSDEAVQVLHR